MIPNLFIRFGLWKFGSRSTFKQNAGSFSCDKYAVISHQKNSLDRCKQIRYCIGWHRSEVWLKPADEGSDTRNFDCDDLGILIRRYATLVISPFSMNSGRIWPSSNDISDTWFYKFSILFMYTNLEILTDDLFVSLAIDIAYHLLWNSS